MGDIKFFFQRERKLLYRPCQGQNFFESVQKHIEFLSSLIKMKKFLSISYRCYVKISNAQIDV